MQPISRRLVIFRLNKTSLLAVGSILHIYASICATLKPADKEASLSVRIYAEPQPCDRERSEIWKEDFQDEIFFIQKSSLVQMFCSEKNGIIRS